MKLTFKTGPEAYPAILHDLAVHGSSVAPRSLPCKELCDIAVRIESASEAVPVSCGRTGFKRVAATEYCQLLAGVSWLEQLDLATNGKFGELAADNGRLRGAYGPRIYGQLPEAVAKLQADPDSRQAVMTISRGVKEDAADGQRDVPCTVAVQYRIRCGKLDATVMMRSSDAWLGIPADWHMQSRLQMTAAWALDVAPGSFTFFASSLHLYEKDIPAAEGLRWFRGKEAEQPPALTCSYMYDKGNAIERIKDAQDLAERLVTGWPVIPAPGTGAAWYLGILPRPEENTPGGYRLCHGCRYIFPAGRACQQCAGEEKKEEERGSHGE